MVETRRKNDELIALAANIPRCSRWHRPPYDDQAALDEVRRIAELGVTVIKLHPHTQKFAIRAAGSRSVPTAGQLGMIVLLTTPTSSWRQSGPFQSRREHARNEIRPSRPTFASGTQFCSREQQGFLQRQHLISIYRRPFTLVAGSPNQIRVRMDDSHIGVDHVMLGSDYPQFTLRQTVDALESLDLDRSEKDKILYETRASC